MSEGLETQDDSSADILTAYDSHGEAEALPRIVPLRGRALIRKHPEDCGGELLSAGGIVIPGNCDPFRTDRDKQFGTRGKRKIHRGVVVALGKPAFEHELHSVERPWHVDVGQEVWYVMAVALENWRTMSDHVFVAQEELQAVTA